jgi:hypothetical protein
VKKGTANVNTNRLVKIFSVLFVCTVFLLAFSQGGAYAFNNYIKTDRAFPTGTMIGPIDVSGKTKGQAEQLLNGKVNQWQQQGIIEVRYVEEKVNWEKSIVQFHIQESVAEAVPNKQNPIYADVSTDDVRQQITDHFPSLNVDQFDTAALRSNLVQQAVLLGTNPNEILLDQYLNGRNAKQTIADAYQDHISITSGINMVLKKLPVIKVPASSQVSFLQQLKTANLTWVSSSDLSTIASLMFQLVLKTNFSVLEKNQSAELPSYTPAGLEAKVDPQMNQDFIFANPNKTAYQLSFQKVRNGLYASLKGIPFAYSYDQLLKDKQTFQPKTVIQYSSTVPNGQSPVVEDKGTAGVLIKTFRETRSQTGQLIRSEEISEDFYPPIPKIELHSLIEQQTVSLDGSFSGQPSAGTGAAPNTAGSNNSSGITSGQANPTGNSTSQPGTTSSQANSIGNSTTQAGTTTSSNGSSSDKSQQKKQAQKSSNSKSGD